MHLTYANSPKIPDVEKVKKFSFSHKKSQKVNDFEAITSKFTIFSKNYKVNDAHF